MQEIQRILFPVDLSDVSQDIVPHVLTMAKRFEAEVHLLFAARVFPYYDNIYVPPVSICSFEQDIVEGAQRRLDEFADEHFKEVSFVTRVVAGDPDEVILEYVAANDIHMVIMGTHGRKGLDRILFGSVANHVVTRSPVPVLTVNPYRIRKP